MKRPDPYERFMELLHRELSFDIAGAPRRASFATLGLDSIDVLEIVVVLDDHGVHLDDDDLSTLETLADLHEAFEGARLRSIDADASPLAR